MKRSLIVEGKVIPFTGGATVQSTFSKPKVERTRDQEIAYYLSRQAKLSTFIKSL